MSKHRPSGTWAKLRASCFSTKADAVVTLLVVGFIAWLSVEFLLWAFIQSASPSGGDRDCRAAGGACWPVFVINARLFLFGTYPTAEHVRPALALVVILGSVILLFLPAMRRWKRFTTLYLLSCVIAAALLLGDDRFGMRPVDVDAVGGLALTVFISWLALPPAFPIALLLALARQGRLPAVGIAAATYIDLVRGIPLIVILFLSATVVPLMLPSDLVVAKVLRAAICITLFAAAFLAEVIRGGLQSLDKGQYQAADALGLRYWQAQLLIVLPQIIPVIARPACGIYITLFKNTSLISVIGLFEITGIASIVSSKPEWSPFSTEIYLVVGAVYVLFCSILSNLSSRIERQFDRTRRA